MGYRSPILAEIYAEVYFTSSFLLSPALLDLVRPLRDEGFRQVEFGPPRAITLNVPEIGVQEASLSPRIRCWTEDRTKLVQLSQNQIVTNLVGEYPGWDAFLRLFEILWRVLPDGFESAVESLSLNTIDKLSPPAEDYSLGKYFNAGGEFVPSWYAESREACDISLGRGFVPQDGFNRAIAIRVRKVEQRFDIQVRCTFHDRLPRDTPLKRKLEQLHDLSNATFEGLVSDYTRKEVMGGWVG